MWQAANNGTKKMRWFLIREVPGEAAEYHNRADGQLRRFGSYETASAAADRLNAAPKMIAGEDLRTGIVVMYCDVRAVILADSPEPWEDRFGRAMSRIWARREDTGVEGWLPFGPGGRFVLA